MIGQEPTNRKRRPLAAGAIVVVLLGASVLLWRPAKERLANLFKPPVESSMGSPPLATEPGAGKILYYEDPMHPWYRSDKPGIAPDCGMKLVPVYASEGAPAVAPPPGSVQISPARQQLMGVMTARAEYRTLDKTIRTVGQVAIDETRLVNVHVKINGWIQKVFVDFTWQQVNKGDPLFTLYSPDLLATEQEYLLALKAKESLGQSSLREVAAGGETLLEAARHRLSLWDLTDDQIRQIEQTGKPQKEITFYAPASGYVLERKAYPNQYVTPDTEIYKLADLGAIWVQADIYEFESPDIRMGDEAVLTSEALPNQTFRGRLVHINPEVRQDTRTLTVRMEFPNPDLKFKPGMFVNVELHRPLGRLLTVPVDAVLDSGQHEIVVVDRGNGSFEPRMVKVGTRAGSYASIVSGLRAGEKVVTRANFLIDSESNLRQALEGMAGMPGMGGAASGAQTAPASQNPSQPAVGRHDHH